MTVRETGGSVENKFEIAGIRRPAQEETLPRRKKDRDRPFLSMVVLAVIVCGCLACELIMTKDPTYLDLQNYNIMPGREFLFGTDTMGRDIFSMIWYGGRISLLIGAASALISTAVAIVYGAASGCAPAWLDALMMRLAEILLSVPGLLSVVMLQAALGEASVLSISFATGITSWMSMAKIVRSEVRQLRNSEYVIASKCMGGGFRHVLRKHLIPAFMPAIMFMAVMNVRNGIVAESTLSFMGIGLPVEVITWGSMLSLAEKALSSNSWWIILIPGFFLVATLCCITNIGDYVRRLMHPQSVRKSL